MTFDPAIRCLSLIGFVVKAYMFCDIIFSLQGSSIMIGALIVAVLTFSRNEFQDIVEVLYFDSCDVVVGMLLDRRYEYRW